MIREAIAGRKKSSCHESVILSSRCLTVPIPIEHHDVEYRHSHVHVHVAVITLKLGWEQILAMQSVDNSRSIGESMLLSSFILGTCIY